MAKKRSRSKTSKKTTKKYKIELTPLSLFLWGGGFFFVLAWIFVLGILVGRGFLPGAVTALSDLKGRMGTLQDMTSRDKPREAGSPKKNDPDPTELAFYEKLSSKKDEAKRKWVPERRITGSNQKPLSTTITAQPKVEGRGETGDIYYTVQLASLGEKGKAEKLIKDLNKRGYPAYYYEAKVKGKTYYRVRCGRFENRKKAGEYSRKLAKESGIKGFVSRVE